jgi:hypothetical protein
MHATNFSCRVEESLQEGPRALDPLPVLGAWAGADIPDASLHSAL